MFMSMKSVLVVTLVFAVLGAAVFGSFLMNHGGGEGHSLCLAAEVSGSNTCLESNILPGSVVNVLAVPFLLLLAAFLLTVGAPGERKPKKPFIGCRREGESFFNPLPLDLLEYLAFHELSPSFA